MSAREFAPSVDEASSWTRWASLACLLLGCPAGALIGVYLLEHAARWPFFAAALVAVAGIALALLGVRGASATLRAWLAILCMLHAMGALLNLRWALGLGGFVL